MGRWRVVRWTEGEADALLVACIEHIMVRGGRRPRLEPRGERGLHPVIEVDGGENATTAAQAAAAGATAIVAGSAIFDTKDYAKAIADIRASAAAAAVTS